MTMTRLKLRRLLVERLARDYADLWPTPTAAEIAADYISERYTTSLGGKRWGVGQPGRSIPQAPGGRVVPQPVWVVERDDHDVFENPEKARAVAVAETLNRIEEEAAST